MLCDCLEEKMKGTSVDGTIRHLFEGKFRSFTRCINVNFVSEREETFYDIQLDVKGCKNLKVRWSKHVHVGMYGRHSSICMYVFTY